jgi:isopropylmalate/isohomocitrate dehydrogenase-like protein
MDEKGRQRMGETMPRKTYRICVLAGDGIGPEVTDCARRVLSSLERAGGPAFSFEAQEAGHGAFEKRGAALPPDVIAVAKQADAILVGAMDVARIPASEPEPLSALRRLLDVHASIRPVRAFAGAPAIREAIDVMVVREVTEGLYSGIEYAAGPDAACAVRLITRQASTRTAEIAFRQAMQRRRKVTAVHKIGVLKLSDGLFLESAREVAKRYPDVEFETRNVDACALELVRHPEIFDVILSTNVFGDILSDVAAGVGSGLGLAPSGCIGDRFAYFEPVHGTAPDIAGRGIANPLATILSTAMMLRHLGEAGWAGAVERSVEAVLRDGPHTGDLGGRATSAEVATAVVTALEKQVTV